MLFCVVFVVGDAAGPEAEIGGRCFEGKIGAGFVVVVYGVIGAAAGTRGFEQNAITGFVVVDGVAL